MDPLTPIPTPAAQRWREFRIQAMPVMTFIVVVCCIGVLWQRYVFPSNIVAQVEAESASVFSTQAGKIETLAVERFQQVKKGDVIAVINVSDTNVLAASLEVSRANFAVLRERIDASEFRGHQTYERERLSFLEQQVQWRIDQENLKLAKAEFEREKQLLNSTPPATSQANYDVALYKMQALDVSVRETEKFLKEKEQTLPKLLSDITNSMTTIEKAVEAERQQLFAASSNIVLRAPIDGVITAVSNHAGGRIMAGDPIAVISPTKAERIIAYMRQPIGATPKPGDTVQVRRRAFKRQTATATISEVGTQLEPITGPLLPPGSPTKIDLGLPFAVNLPSQLNLVPGEIVDVIYEPKN
jgi:multidrug resistance efflux pump